MPAWLIPLLPKLIDVLTPLIPDPGARDRTQLREHAAVVELPLERVGRRTDPKHAVIVSELNDVHRNPTTRERPNPLWNRGQGYFR